MGSCSYFSLHAALRVVNYLDRVAARADLIVVVGLAGVGKTHLCALWSAVHDVRAQCECRTSDSRDIRHLDADQFPANGPERGCLDAEAIATAACRAALMGKLPVVCITCTNFEDVSYALLQQFRRVRTFVVTRPSAWLRSVYQLRRTWDTSEWPDTYLNMTSEEQEASQTNYANAHLNVWPDAVHIPLGYDDLDTSGSGASDVLSIWLAACELLARTNEKSHDGTRLDMHGLSR